MAALNPSRTARIGPGTSIPDATSFSQPSSKTIGTTAG